MRMRCIPLLMTAALFVQAQQDPLVSKSVGDLYIPVELVKTLRADRVHRGDPVEFTTLEAVLIGQNLVMPPHSNLFGRIVGAAPRQGDKSSWLVLLVERAEWKQHSIPLHAFISSQIRYVPTPNPHTNLADNATPSNMPSRAGLGRIRTRTPTETNQSSLPRFPEEKTTQSQGQIMARVPTLENVRIVRDKDGISYLVSAKTNLKLPSGAAFMLQNCPVTSEQSAAVAPH